MRKPMISEPTSYKILGVDDETSILDFLNVIFTKSGYSFVGIPDPIEAMERMKTEHFDLLILDFNMTPLHGDQVVDEIRKFNKEIFILLLTGHSDLAPPLDLIKRLDIQGYCEKSNKFDTLLLLVESSIKAISQRDKIKQVSDELETAYINSMQALRHTVEIKDVYTKGHSDRVSELSVLIGKRAKLSDEDLKTLKIGGLFHDIGKIGIPDHILLKSSKLTDDEYSEVKNHPSIGELILANAAIFRETTPIVKYHHERWDGKGYPSKLKGEEIPYLARIAAIADNFDAMTSKRSSREPLSLDIVTAEFENGKGVKFDPELTDIFLDILNNDFASIEAIQKRCS